MIGYQPTNRQVEEWTQRRAKGEAYWRIAAEYDVCRQTVSNYLNGRYKPQHTPRIEPSWWSEATELRAQGLSLMTVALHVGKSKSAVRAATNEQARIDAARDSHERYKARAGMVARSKKT